MLEAGANEALERAEDPTEAAELVQPTGATEAEFSATDTSITHATSHDLSYTGAYARTVVITDLDPKIDNSALLDTFGLCGKVRTCEVAGDSSGAPKGCGFVHYETELAAQKAVTSISGVEVGSRVVAVAGVSGEDTPGPRCPQGHPLKPARVPSSDCRCDVCEATVPRDTILWGCRSCDYDECQLCCALVHASPCALPDALPYDPRDLPHWTTSACWDLEAKLLQQLCGTEQT